MHEIFTIALKNRLQEPLVSFEPLLTAKGKCVKIKGDKR